MFDHFAAEEDDYEDMGDLDFIINMKEEDELLIDDSDDTDDRGETIEKNQVR